jgi:hypothetical protein
MELGNRDWDHIRRLGLRRERNRLIKLGVIRPAYAMQPQLMVRNPDVKGGWSPGIGKIEELRDALL